MKRVCRIPDRSARVPAKLRVLPPLPADPFCRPRPDMSSMPTFVASGRIARDERADCCGRLQRHPLARYARRRSTKPHRRWN